MTRPPALPAEPADAVALVFAEALDTADIDRETGFFDLGADSVTIVRAVKRLRERWPQLRSVDVFAYPTVTNLASYLEASAPANEDRSQR